MADESEEACLVNPKSPGNGSMPYTDGLNKATAVSSVPTNVNTAQAQASSSLSAQQTHSTTIYHTTHNNTTNNPYDINDDIILSQFHADAIKQAGCGKFQFLATIFVGLGLAGHVIQVYSIFYILPSTEVEYCIFDDEKNWLANITLLGIGCGALLFGALAGKNGRRRILIICLSISSIFSVIAAFMPTYGPFMLARFIAAIGIGGAFPCSCSYLCEVTPLSGRARVIAFLCTIGVTGGIFAGAVAMALIPANGQAVVAENKQHFSAWHRYLLFMTIVQIIGTILIFWLPESPRYLLANSSEVQALQTYQQIFKTNRAGGGYALTELELPGVRTRRPSTPSSIIAAIVHNIYACCGTFVQLYNEKYCRTTYLLMASWFAAVFVFHGMTIYISEYSKAIQTNYYIRNTANKTNITYQNTKFDNLDNMVFDQCRFENCTFRRVFISHVLFHNSTFRNTDFLYVKTSRAEFRNSTVINSKFVETEVSNHNFIDCNITNTIFDRHNTACDMDFDYNIYSANVWKANLGGLIPCILAILSVGEAIQRLGRAPVASCCFAIAMILCVILGFVNKDEIVIWIGGCAQGFILAGLTALSLFIIETYTTIVRCTALGVFLCFSQIGALLGSALYSHLPVVIPKVAATISTIFVAIPFVSSVVLKDPCLLV